MEEAVGAIFSQGQRSIKIPVPVYIRASASIAGTKEGQGPFGDQFDVVGKDDRFGCETWEEAESTLQRPLRWQSGNQEFPRKKSGIYLLVTCLVNLLRVLLDLDPFRFRL